MMAASVPALAETMRIGDQAVVKKCKEYITLREADNVQATELARIPLGGQVIYLDPAKNGFARVEYGDTQGFVKTEYLGNQTARGTPFAITEEERRNVNLFLTNFTETGMNRYDAASTTDAELVRFAVLHAWLNRSGQWDVTEWGSRLEQDNVTDDVLRYFGRPLILLDQPDFDYDGAYYYMHEPGAPIGLGFVCVSEVETLGGGLYRVYFGVYGACSTMAESLSLAAMTIDGGYADTVCAMTSSHFCSAERQFRLPLEYGGQRTPTAQWTVTGAGALLLTSEGEGPYVTHVTTGRIRDAGVTDANNMGAAMAPAAYETLRAHFADTGRTPADYAAIITGDLGKIGHEILTDLFLRDGVDLGVCSTDCGMLIFNPETQDVHAGGSGCGCSASVLCGHILQRMTCGDWPRVLFAATGALMSPTTSQQGESIPGICHAVVLDVDRG